MSTRRMKGPFGSISILFVVFAVMLAMAGLIWAHWYTSLDVQANINTGNVGIGWSEAWTNDDGTVNDWDEWDDGGCPWLPDGDCEYDQWGDSSGDPASFGPLDRYEKDVARCSAGGGDTLWIDIENGYPSYHCTVQTGIHSYGSVPIKAMPSHYEVYRGEQECDWWSTYNEEENWYSDPTGYEIHGAYNADLGQDLPYVEVGGTNGVFDDGDVWILRYDDDENGFDYIDWNDTGAYDDGDEVIYGGCNFHGEPIEVLQGDGWFEWGWTDDDGWHAEITGHVPSLFDCGTQIDPEEWHDAQFNFHIEQEAAQGATYRLEMHQEFVNWNEFNEDECANGNG